MKKLIFALVLFFSYIKVYSQINLDKLLIWMNADSVYTSANSIDTIYNLANLNQNGFYTGSFNKAQLSEKKSSLNNHPAIIFNNSPLRFNSSMLPIDSFSVFIVAKQYFPHDGAILSTLSGSNGLLLRYKNTNPAEIRLYFGSSFDSQLPTARDTSYNIISFINRASSSRNDSIFLYINQMLVNKNTLTLSPNHESNLWLGALPGGGIPFNGEIAEIIFYNKALNDSERTIVENYIRLKYAPPVSIGQDITIPYGFCNYTINAPNRFVKYKWNNNPNDTLPTLIVNRTGSYFVEATDIFGFKSYDTINVTFPALNVLSDITICSGNSASLNLGLSGAYSFNWNNGDTTSAINISNAGSYFCTITDTLGCSVNSDTAVITVDEFALTASLGNDTTLCSGDLLYIKNLNGTVVSSYSWSNGSTDSAITVTQSGQYMITVTNNNGCIANDTIAITINGYTPITLFIIQPACITDSVQFIDQSYSQVATDTIISWYWDFDNGNTSSLKNPKYIFNTPGTHTITLTTQNNNGCKKSYSLNYQNYPLPQPSFKYVNNCDNTPTQFTNLTNSGGDVITYVRWQFTNNITDTSNLYSPNFAFNQSGTYPVSITVHTANGCRVTKTMPVTIKKSPVADFYAGDACAGDVFTLVDISDVPFPHTVINYSWGFGDNTSAINTPNPQHYYNSAGQYSVTLSIIASNGCKDTLIKTISVDNKPVADFNYSNNCLNSSTLFTDATNHPLIAQHYWQIADLFSTTQPNFNYQFTQPGLYEVKHIVKTQGGCPDTVSKLVRISELPKALFTILPNDDDLPVMLTIQNKSTNAVTYLWNFGNGQLSNTTDGAPVYSIPGDYVIQLTAYNAEGCADSATQLIKISKAAYDLALINFNAVPTSKQFLNPTIVVANSGTRPIYYFTISCLINNNAQFTEDWNGSLLPGQLIEYPLKSSVKINNDLNQYICINLGSPNNKAETDTTNNLICKAISSESFIVGDLTPNPAYSNTVIPIICPQEGEVSIVLYNITGAVIFEDTFSALKGLNLYELLCTPYSAGVYQLKVSYNNYHQTKRLLIR
jgi:PKD repeat protein